jgi:hypothetical protein
MVIFGLAKISGLFVCIVHVIACLWYAIGTFFDEDAVSWTAPFQEESLLYRYTTSLHWAVAALGGSGLYGLDAVNVYERIFANVVLIFSFVISATFASMITSRMTRMEMHTERHDHDFAVLRNYLNSQRDLDNDFTMRVMRSARHALKMQEKNVPEQDISLLLLLSEQLKTELHYNIRIPVLVKHPFFDMYHVLNIPGMRRITHNAIVMVQLAQDEVLFTDDEESTRMFFVQEGSLRYERLDEVYRTTSQPWLCEQSLWLAWVHMGTTIGEVDCNILVLDAFQVQDILKYFTVQVLEVLRYAREYIEIINQDIFSIQDIPAEFLLECEQNEEKKSSALWRNSHIVPDNESQSSDLPEKKKKDRTSWLMPYPHS